MPLAQAQQRKGQGDALGTPNDEQNGANKEQNWGKKDKNGAFLGTGYYRWGLYPPPLLMSISEAHYGWDKLRFTFNPMSSFL